MTPYYLIVFLEDLLAGPQEEGDGWMHAHL